MGGVRGTLDTAAPNPGLALLVVEDDRALSGMLAQLFTDEGYRVDTAYDGQQGMHRGLTGNYDAMIVDRGLPVMDGAELVALLRSRGITTPALILTARGAVEDRVEGLDAGAQDYLVKPFEIPELLARVRALVRRTENAAVVNAGGLALDRVTRRVSGATAEEVEVELSEREAALLGTLMAAPKRVFSRSRSCSTRCSTARTPAEPSTSTCITFAASLASRWCGPCTAPAIDSGWTDPNVTAQQGFRRPPPSDLAVVKRAGRVAALQASAALALVLLLVGGMVFAVYVRTQRHQIDAELSSVAMIADDTNDPPPDMELAMRELDGEISASDGGKPGVPLLTRTRRFQRHPRGGKAFPGTGGGPDPGPGGGDDRHGALPGGPQPAADVAGIRRTDRHSGVDRGGGTVHPPVGAAAGAGAVVATAVRGRRVARTAGTVDGAAHQGPDAGASGRDRRRADGA